MKAFEKEFAEYCGVKYAVGVASGTDAIHLCLRAMEVGQGDEVISVANTFIATTEAITMTKAIVQLVDCRSEDYLIDHTQLEDLINDRTKAIVPVHLFGQPADIDPILEIAQ